MAQISIKNVSITSIILQRKTKSMMVIAVLKIHDGVETGAPTEHKIEPLIL